SRTSSWRTADRAVGMVFFRDYFLMDVELLGGGGRAAIEREMTKRGKKALLPTLAPFRSTDWPLPALWIWTIKPSPKTGRTFFAAARPKALRQARPTSDEVRTVQVRRLKVNMPLDRPHRRPRGSPARRPPAERRRC